MKIITRGEVYELWCLGGKPERFHLPEFSLCVVLELLAVLIDRTRYLNKILPCTETEDARAWLEIASDDLCEIKHESVPVRESRVTVLDVGHVYHVPSIERVVVFVKRSGGAISYQEEWPGIQSQELMRMLISYLYEYPCIADSVRKALFAYEVRAHRRKLEKVNRKSPAHDDAGHPRGWRYLPYDDVPFSDQKVEKLPCGQDGHVMSMPH